MSVSTSTIRCPVCVDSATSRWGSRGGHAIFECGACGLTFFDLSSFTAHDYRDYYRYTETWSETDIVYEVEVRRRRTVRQLRRLASMIPGRRLLDIGAGPGYFCRIALDEGWDAEGVEISARAVEIGRDRLGVSYIDLEAVPAASVDVVCCRHVVEHVADPLGLLRALRRVLKPGGVLVVHAPHREPCRTTCWASPAHRWREWQSERASTRSPWRPPASGAPIPIPSSSAITSASGPS